MSTLIRNTSKSIDYLRKHFPVIALLGARQVGKSTIMRGIESAGCFYDLEKAADYGRVESDIALALEQYPIPRLIDEAQLLPELFPALRVMVDKEREQGGQFIISGSSSPVLLEQLSESLAGRIATLEINPLSWNESLSLPISDFYHRLELGESFEGLPLRYSQSQLFELCLLGGYPEPYLKRKEQRFFDLWMENYYKSYVERDIRSLFPGLQLENYRRFIKMLAQSSGEIFNASNYARSLDVSQPTVKNYVRIAEGTFLWRNLYSYESSGRKRVVKMPRGHLRDTGLTCYLMDIPTVDALRGHSKFGHIWETFVIEQIIRSLQSLLITHKSFFYRTHNQTEIDLVLQGRFGLIPIEVKAGSSVNKKHLQGLEIFIEDNNCPYGILVNNSSEVCRLKPKIWQLPARCL